MSHVESLPPLEISKCLHASSKTVSNTCYFSGRNHKPNRPNRTKPNRLILESAGTGRGTKPNRTGPSHDASEKRRPNRVESGNKSFRTEPNRTHQVSKVRHRNESNRAGSFLTSAPGRGMARQVRLCAINSGSPHSLISKAFNMLMPQLLIRTSNLFV